MEKSKILVHSLLSALVIQTILILFTTNSSISLLNLISPLVKNLPTSFLSFSLFVIIFYFVYSIFDKEVTEAQLSGNVKHKRIKVRNMVYIFFVLVVIFLIFWTLFILDLAF